MYKLEHKGYIIRNKSDIDARELVVCVTKEGLKLKKEALSVPQNIAKCVCLEREEALELYKLIHKVLDGFYGK